MNFFKEDLKHKIVSSRLKKPGSPYTIDNWTNMATSPC